MAWPLARCRRRACTPRVQKLRLEHLASLISTRPGARELPRRRRYARKSRLLHVLQKCLQTHRFFVCPDPTTSTPSLPLLPPPTGACGCRTRCRPLFPARGALLPRRSLACPPPSRMDFTQALAVLQQRTSAPLAAEHGGVDPKGAADAGTAPTAGRPAPRRDGPWAAQETRHRAATCADLRRTTTPKPTTDNPRRQHQERLLHAGT